MNYHDDTQKDMVAVETPLSVEAQLRIDLQTMDDIYHSLPDSNWSDIQRQQFEDARWAVGLNLSSKLHTILDALDASRKEIERLQAANHDSYLDGFSDGGEAYYRE